LKRAPELRDLSDDHHTALVLARRCERAASGRPEVAAAAWDEVREAFAGHLEPHFEIEERHLLPALASIGEEGLAEAIRGDHAALRALVAEGRGEAALRNFGERLRCHVRFEEREVFEGTQDRLPASALRALAEACRTTPRVCPASLWAGRDEARS